MLRRVGAKAIASKLRPWRALRQAYFDAGGLPSTSVSSAFMQLQQGLSNGAWMLVQQDWATFYGSLSLDVVEVIMKQLQAPPELIPFLRSFYGLSQSIFVSQNSTWLPQRAGLVQGCPLSSYRAAAVTRCPGAAKRSGQHARIAFQPYALNPQT